MQYTWQGRCAFDMASIPRAAAQQLKLASPLQLRVLIWLCCVGQGRFEKSACAVACASLPDACEEALQYWVEQGIVRLDAELPAAVVAAPSLPVAAPAVEPPAEVPPVAVEPLVETVSPAASRPSRTQVLQVRAEDERFAFLLETASAKLGKVLSPADMSVYLYLYRDVGLPPEVILMIIGYAVKNGKAKLTYIEKTALGWAENGITTIAAADEYLCRLERNASAWETLSSWSEHIPARPTIAQKETAVRWIDEWAMPREVIEAVIAYTVETKGSLRMPYADRILERFYQQGIQTLEKAKEELSGTAQKTPTKKHGGRMKTATDRAPSFNIGQYEELALRHRPQPPKKEG